MNSVQLPVQLPCSWRATSVSAGPCLHIGKLHACMRAARLSHVIGRCCSQANLRGSMQASVSQCVPDQVSHGIEFIRQAQQLASKPSQIIPAKQWPLGFNVGLAEHAVELTRTKTAGRGMAHQRTRQALCRRSIFPCSSRSSPHGTAMTNRLAKTIAVAPAANSYKDCWSGQRVCTRGNDRTAGAIWKGRPGGPGRMAGRGDDAIEIAISNIPRQYSGALLKILVGLGSKSWPSVSGAAGALKIRAGLVLKMRVGGHD
jgi:hypothetical protein